jgi:hypothetical protein
LLSVVSPVALRKTRYPFYILNEAISSNRKISVDLDLAQVSSLKTNLINSSKTAKYQAEETLWKVVCNVHKCLGWCG